MSRIWKKLGLLYCPPSGGVHPKLASHASNPLPVHIEDDIYRVFFSGRDNKNRSSVGAVDIDICKQEILVEHDMPFFEHGPQESFFCDGVSIGNCYVASGHRYMLFMGWQNPVDEHWRGDIGRLKVLPDLTLELESETPFLSSDPVDPISLSYPWVSQKKDGTFQMWYGSTHTWDLGNNEMLHPIHYATSLDGHTWVREGLAVPYEPNIAQAFSRPTVSFRDTLGRYEMWFSYRSGIGTTYRIGYAHSENGEDWELGLEDVGIDVSPGGWDSEMLAYPFVFEHSNRLYMLYNGNGYGLSGFGLAVMEENAG